MPMSGAIRKRRVGLCQLNFPRFHNPVVYLLFGNNNMELFVPQFLPKGEVELCKTSNWESSELPQFSNINNYCVRLAIAKLFYVHGLHCISAPFFEVGNKRIDLVGLSCPSPIFLFLYHIKFFLYWVKLKYPI